eukprot:TRINITY_DN9237_c0_g1_i1.p1 TRINITY_DN9237_c0_g1~~TRINITY_DN9237_c0_g1_i1.p1  ORF type:complete len:701 (+),score=118.47 TRINITY_DN9237_c0_g1_i1:110-2212(+)
MCDSCACTSFVPHAWKEGRCRECLHPLSMHNRSELLVTNTTPSPTSSHRQSLEYNIEDTMHNRKVGRLSVDRLSPFTLPIDFSRQSGEYRSTSTSSTPLPSPSFPPPYIHNEDHSTISDNSTQPNRHSKRLSSSQSQSRISSSFPSSRGLPAEISSRPLPVPPPKDKYVNEQGVLQEQPESAPTDISADQPSSEVDDSSMRQKVIDELLQTERDYCSDLDFVVDEIMTPLSKVLTKAELTSIFSNMQVIRNLNNTLLHDLSLNPSSAGQIFQKFSAFFKSYARYCTDQPAAVTASQQIKNNNSEVERILKRSKENPRAGSLGLEDFLIKPVQRICKYPLLFQGLLRYTPETHPDHGPLSAALATMQGVALHVNEFSRESESMNRVVDIQNIISDLPFPLVTSSRRLCHEGFLLVRASDVPADKPWSNRQAWLFNDMLLLGRPPSNPFSRRFHFVEHHDLTKVDVIAGGVGADATGGAAEKSDTADNFNILFYIVENKGDSVEELAIVQCRSKAERDQWVQLAKQQINDLSEIHRSKSKNKIKSKETVKEVPRHSLNRHTSSIAHDELIRSLNEVMGKNNNQKTEAAIAVPTPADTVISKPDEGNSHRLTFRRTQKFSSLNNLLAHGSSGGPTNDSASSSASTRSPAFQRSSTLPADIGQLDSPGRSRSRSDPPPKAPAEPSIRAKVFSHIKARRDADHRP